MYLAVGTAVARSGEKKPESHPKHSYEVVMIGGGAPCVSCVERSHIPFLWGRLFGWHLRFLR